MALLRPHLTRENAGDLLARADGKSKRQVQVLVAEVAPRPDMAPVVRRLPTPAPQVRPDPVAAPEVAPAPAPPPPLVLEPIAR
ncbi:MAG TPA: hypothetical protein VMZ28_09585, partial [Kofleriaceae bacterium]|nr:hypothetical protein [Kofleriaceae bacterium]